MAEYAYPPVSFDTHPDAYVHWKLQIDGAVATLKMDVQEDRPLWPGRYELKLNSYDLSVDVELADAIQRLRFEHPDVRAVVITGAQERVFCAGANIRMLSQSPHAFKVNFCKFTNETRGSIEDACAHSNQAWIAALNGTASGGGYELALCCEQILLIDDGNAAVALPEVPLLGVLPGTGGLTRVTDKRKVRRDIADVFCTKAEGFKARDGVKYGLVDQSFPRSQWKSGVQAAAQAAAQGRPLREGPGIALPALSRADRKNGWSYRYVDVAIDGRVGTILLKGPDALPERSAETWALRAFRELDDALLRLRFNHLDVGVLLLKTEGDAGLVLRHDEAVREAAPLDWFHKEILLFQARTLRRLDNMAKSLFAIITPGNCFAGPLFELVLAADRAYMLADEDRSDAVQLSAGNGGAWPMSSGRSRLAARFPGDPDAPGRALGHEGRIDAETADELGLVTAAPDDIDWEDEVRIAVEERVSLSPDALTGMEQNLRFGGPESSENKIYGRLTAWQNWIFQRPNAVGDRGALTMYGHPEQPVFDYRRT